MIQSRKAQCVFVLGFNSPKEDRIKGPRTAAQLTGGKVVLGPDISDSKIMLTVAQRFSEEAKTIEKSSRKIIC